MTDQEEIKSIRDAIKEKKAEWVAVENKLTRMSSEKRKNLLGYLPETEEEKAKLRGGEEKKVDIALGELGVAPSSWDWRNSSGGLNWTTPVKDQCNCGSCVAFGALGALECQLKILRNNSIINPDFSEAHIFFCSNRQCFRGDPRYGWGSSAALAYLRDNGAPDEACFRYPCPTSNLACNTCSDWQQRATKITGWKDISSREDMKSWISTRGPLITGFTVYDDFFSYGGGVYRHVWGGVAGGHCVTVVGYNDTDQCWICKNSWGVGWGESGYFRIRYGDSGIDSSMSGIEGIYKRGWENGKRVIGLWAINENRNVWAYIQDLGWRKLANDSDNITINLLKQLAHAKATSRNINIYEDGIEGGTIYIKQVYVW